MATDIKKISNNRDRVLKAVDESSGLLGNVAHKMVVDCGKDDRWLNDSAENQGHDNIGSVAEIRNIMDPSALLSVMLRVLTEHRNYNQIQGINFGFVDKVRKIRNDATHYDKAFLSNDYQVDEAIRSVKGFNIIIQAAGATTASSRPATPQFQRPQSDRRQAFASSRPAPRTPVRRPTAPSYGTPPRSFSGARSPRRENFLARPQFWALAAATVTLIAVDFWGYSGVPESGDIWKAPVTMAGIGCAVLALFSGVMTGRGSRRTALFSLALLPIVLLMFVLFQSGEMESDGYAALLGFLMLLWAGITALIPVVSILGALRGR